MKPAAGICFTVSAALCLAVGGVCASNSQAAPPSAAQPSATPPLPDARPAIIVPDSATTTQYNPASGFPDHNGKLSGMMVIIPREEVAEFSKPSGSERHLNRVARAEPGAVLAIKLVFVGIQPDWQGQVDVNYDLTVQAPDGRVYGDDYRALTGVKGKVDKASGVFDNRAKVVLMQFESHDLPGVYTVRAVLHDRISGLDLPLQSQVELLPPPPPIPGITVPDTGLAVGAPPATVTPATESAAKAKPVRSGKKYRRRRRRH